MNLNKLTIKEARAGLKEKKFSVRELVDDCLTAIKEKDSTLHAYLEVFEEARKEAGILDKMGQDLRDPPLLFGIPMSVKDNILVEGKRSTAGSKILAPYTASYDATVIRKIKKQGAVILGKTNMDEFAMGSSTENSAFGPTKNPHGLNRVPGGSSGGSAAAVAADLCLGAIGSDTGGSIRQPASFCGVVGLKPTYGSVSRHGLIAMASSLDQIGPLAKTVADARIIFDAIKGADNFDATAKQENESSATKSHSQKLRIGIPKEYFGQGLDPEVEKIIKSAFKKIENAGAIIEEISLPHAKYALPAYYIIVPSEVSANLARFDGIRYGFKTPTADTLFEVYGKSRAEGFGPEVKRRIMLGTYVLSAGYYDAYYLKAQKVRALIKKDFEEAFKKVDLIAGPTTPTPAFSLGSHTANPLEMYLADIYTVAINLAGIPALSMPAGNVTDDGKKLPVGLQLIGKWFQEDALLEYAEYFEKIIEI